MFSLKTLKFKKCRRGLHGLPCCPGGLSLPLWSPGREWVPQVTSAQSPETLTLLSCPSARGGCAAEAETLCDQSLTQPWRVSACFSFHLYFQCRRTGHYFLLSKCFSEKYRKNERHTIALAVTTTKKFMTSVVLAYLETERAQMSRVSAVISLPPVQRWLKWQTHEAQVALKCQQPKRVTLFNPSSN